MLLWKNKKVEDKQDVKEIRDWEERRGICGFTLCYKTADDGIVRHSRRHSVRCQKGFLIFFQNSMQLEESSSAHSSRQIRTLSILELISPRSMNLLSSPNLKLYMWFYISPEHLTLFLIYTSTNACMHTNIFIILLESCQNRLECSRPLPGCLVGGLWR